MHKITYSELEAMLMDPDVPEEDIAPYLTVDPEESSAFDPQVVPDRDKVELSPEGEVHTENAMRWANEFARGRRRRRFRQRLDAGSRLPVVVSEGARSRSSFGYFLGAGTTTNLPWLQCLHHTRGGSGSGEPVCREHQVSRSQFEIRALAVERGHLEAVAPVWASGVGGI